MRVPGGPAPRAEAAGAGDGIRTRDIQLGKLTLYRLSYSRAVERPRARKRWDAPGGLRRRPGVWWAGLDSNQRRHKPTDLQSVPFNHSGTYPCPSLARRRGLWPRRALPLGERRPPHEDEPGVEPPIGIEPTTFRLQVGCSTD